MKTPAVKGLFAAAAAVLFAATPLVGRSVTIDVTKVQQRYPWNGLVDIDYTIQWEAGEKPEIGDNLEVLMVDKSAAPVVTNVANCFLQAPLPMTNGSHRITWDANYDGVKVRTDHAEFIVKIAHYAEAYMVIDVSAGPGNVHKVDFLNGMPTGGFNVSKYKGDKIVLRRIHPGSYVAGSPTNEANHAANEHQHRVAISKPFYIGIFEITQKQFRNVMGNYEFSNDLGDERPADSLTYDTVRGGNWPTEPAPAGGSFMARMVANCKARDAAGNYTEPVTGFDLPTEFQWEYACRAGTTKAVSVTNDFDNTSAASQYEQLAKVSRYKGNGGSTGHHAAVGTYEPNPWGLYDMLGNVYEWCRDWYVDDVVSLRQYVDPKGPDWGTDNKRVLRGASWYDDSLCRSGMRAGHARVATTFGFRLARILP